jgi:acetyltransferase-like isoleucine patch superfamily enzyme
MKSRLLDIIRKHLFKYMRDYADYRSHNIGEYTYGTPCVRFGRNEGGGQLIIGKFCSIADGVVILLGGNHRTDWVTTYPFNALLDEFKNIPGHPSTKGDVVIGNDAWLAHQSLILSGVTIGDGAVVAARAVVTKNVPPYAIVAGNPARVIRYRFSDDTIARLLRIRWWDWDIAKIKQNVPAMLATGVDEFARRHDPQR